MAKVRLNKYIASAGICSRRKADEMIEQGLVNVNGKRVSELGYLVSEKDKVFIEGKLIHPLKHEYYRFYKPAGYITTADDEKGRKTIYDILPEEFHKLNPVGRLDRESTGLIILTNDGELINELTHPSVKIQKVYIVSINGRINQNHIDQMAAGIEIEPNKKAYAEVEVLEISNKSTLMEVVLYQGLNRQIRKMFDYLGFEVESLKRVQHATITLDGLKRGEFKPIKPKQVKELKAYIEKAAKK